MSQPVLEVTDLVKDYGSFRAVDHVSFSIAKGQVMGLLGPNGAGKSTTIQMLLGITLATAGQVKYFGHDFKTHRSQCLQRINFASAYNNLQGRITVQENLRVFAELYGVRAPKQKIEELMDYFELSRLRAVSFWDLSAGERTRVNLAKSLLNDPELLLMDEPTASLDPDIADKTLTLIEELRRNRELSILFTSHNMAEVARVCDEVIFLQNGVIVSQDTPENLTKRITNTKVVLQYKGERGKIAAVLEAQDAVYTFDGRDRVVATINNQAVATLLAAVHDAGVPIRDIDIRKPTLEDVFLDIARRKQA